MTRNPFHAPAARRGPLLALALAALVLPAATLRAATPCDGDRGIIGPPTTEQTVVTVGPGQAAALPGIVRAAKPDTTILLLDGRYPIAENLVFEQPHVTLRSQSGNAGAVVIDPAYSTSAAEPILIRDHHVRIADLSVRRAWYHLVHITGQGQHARLHNLRLEDGRQQFVKVNSEAGSYPDYGIATCLELRLTDAGRTFIEANPTPGFLCYTGGLDFLQTWGWQVTDSRISGIYCTNGGLAQHGIHFFDSNRDPIVERNVLVDNARGIGFGLGSGGLNRDYPDDPLEGSGLEKSDVSHLGGRIRNNFISAAIGNYYDSGISLESAWNVAVAHNTIYSEEGSFNAAIDVRFRGSQSIELLNNLYYPRISVRDGAPQPDSAGNVEASADLFVGLDSGNLHLRPGAVRAIDKGVPNPTADDLDRERRDGRPDVGADEFGADVYSADFDDEEAIGGLDLERGDWGRVGGSLVGVPDSADGLDMAATALAGRSFRGCAVCRVRARLTAANTFGPRAQREVRLLGWYEGAARHVAVVLRPDQDLLSLEQRSAAGTLLIASRPVALDADVAYDVEIAFDGAVYRVYLDGALLMKRPSALARLPFGTVGFAARNADIVVDEVTVRR